MLQDRATCEDNHRRFVERICESEEIWGLNSDTGFAWCESNETADRAVIMFWSDRAYAERARQNGFDDSTVEAVSLFDFLFRWLPGMTGDEAFAGTNWDASLVGIEIAPELLQDQIIDTLTPDVLAAYRKRLQSEIADQNGSK